MFTSYPHRKVFLYLKTETFTASSIAQSYCAHQTIYYLSVLLPICMWQLHIDFIYFNIKLVTKEQKKEIDILQLYSIFTMSFFPRSAFIIPLSCCCQLPFSCLFACIYIFNMLYRPCLNNPLPAIAVADPIPWIANAICQVVSTISQVVDAICWVVSIIHRFVDMIPRLWVQFPKLWVRLLRLSLSLRWRFLESSSCSISNNPKMQEIVVVVIH